jgi:hypothetical protein
MRNPDWIWAAATPWIIGLAALLCDQFEPIRPLIIGMRALFTMATCGALCLVLISKARASAGTSPTELYLFARLVSRWVYILIYVLAMARVGLYLYEVSQQCALCGVGGPTRAIGSLEDFRFYVASAVLPLWVVRAVILAGPFRACGAKWARRAECERSVSASA